MASPKNARKRKVYSILSSRHRDEVSSFHLDQELGGENNDYSLIPMVLACAHLYSEVEYKRTEQLRNQRWGLYPMCTQEQDGAVEPLSLMYENYAAGKCLRCMNAVEDLPKQWASWLIALPAKSYS